MKKVYIVPQVEELPMEPMSGIMHTSGGTPIGPAPRRRTGETIE